MLRKKKRPSKLNLLIYVGVFPACVLLLFGGISALSLVIRILFVLVLPGFSILQVTATKELDFLEKMVLSPVIGIAVASLLSLYLSLLNIPINATTVIMAVLLISIPLLAYSWKRGKLKKTSFKSSFNQTTVSILALLVTASIIIISLPIPRNGILIPTGDDPATSTLVATMIVQQGKIPQSWAPYFPEQTTFTYPPGYPSLLAFLHLLDTSNSIPALATLFAALFAIIPCQVFVLTRRLIGNIRIALCSAAFLALLSFGFYHMVKNGRFPALVGLALTSNLLLFSYLYFTTGKRRLLLLASISLAGLFLVYSTSFIIASLSVVLFFSFALLFSGNKKESLVGAATVIILGIALVIPWIINILNRIMVRVPTREYEALVTWFNRYSLQNNIGSANIFIYYCYWLLLLGIVVFLAIKIRKRNASLLLAWFLSICLLMSNEIFQFHFPGWYYLQSWNFLNPNLTVPFSILAGIVIIKTSDVVDKNLRKFSRKVSKNKWRNSLIVAPLLAIILGGIVIIFWTPEINDGLEILQENRISTADYNAIQWISANTPEDAVIFNDHWVATPSIWIPIISHRRIVMPLLSISEVGWTEIMFTRQDESIIVARYPNSSEALSILKKYEVSYIYLSNRYNIQIEEWRNNYNASLFLQSPHYELAYNEENAWIIRVIY
jgi:hypothetical protein